MAIHFINISRRIVVFLFFIFFNYCLLAQFQDVTDQAGIFHAHVSGALMGGGIGVFDFDNDGFEDLYVTGGEGKDRLYLNSRDNTYEDISHILLHNENKTEITTSVTPADFNDDGCTDLFITSFNREENCILLKNDCNGGLLEVSFRSGIIETSSSMGAAVIDFDLDGDLDLYVINYIEKSRLITDENGKTIGFDHECSNNFLYVNDGDMKFRESAELYGAQGSGCGLAVTSINFIEDSPAIYIANDFGEWIQPNELLIYDAELGVFVDKAAEHGLDYGLYGMGIAIGDPDRDDDFDMYVSNLGQNAYLVNNGHNLYSENSVANGIDNTQSTDSTLAISWGVLFFDYNNNGWQDLFVSNGWIPSASFIKSGFIDSSRFFVNNEGDFTDETISHNVGFDYINRGVVYTDMDNDGLLDLVLAGLDDTDTPDSERRYRLLRNNSGNDNNFISIELEGELNNNQGYGSLIDVYSGEEKYKQLLFPGGTFCSQSSNRVHVGLGGHQEIDSIIVSWPDGQIDKIVGIPINQRVEIKEGGTFEILGCMNIEDPYYNPMATKSTGCFLDNSTSTVEIKKKLSINIFPTIISTQYLNITSQVSLHSSRIKIIDSYGQTVMNQIFDLTAGETYTTSLMSDLPPSVYFIHITSEGKVIAGQKVIKQ